MNKAQKIFDLIASKNEEVFAPSIISIELVGSSFQAKWIDDRDCEMSPIRHEREISLEDIAQALPQAEEMMPFEASFRFANGVLQIITEGGWNGILHGGWWHESDSFFFKVAMRS